MRRATTRKVTATLVLAELSVLAAELLIVRFTGVNISAMGDISCVVALAWFLVKRRRSAKRLAAEALVS